MGGRLVAVCRASILALAASLALGGSATAGGDETLKFQLFQAPKFSGSDEMGPLHRTLIVLEGTSAEEWSEGIEVLSVARKGPYKDAKEVSAALSAMRREACAVVVDSVLASGESSVFWSMASDSCGPWGSQFSMTRVLCGKKMTFILIYTSLDPSVARERREQVASAFLAASVVKE